MTVEEKVPVLRTMLDGVYVDVKTKRVVGIKAKAPFTSALRLCNQAVRLIDEEGELLVAGDPEGIRTLHAQWPFVARVDTCGDLLWTG